MKHYICRLGSARVPLNWLQSDQSCTADPAFEYLKYIILFSNILFVIKGSSDVAETIVKNFYAAGFDALVKRRAKCINAGRGYVEK
jgi:hypothetical protein